MPDLFLIIKEFFFNNPTLVTWLVTGLIIVLGLLLQTSCLKEYIEEWKLIRLLKNAGVESRHNISITDALDEKVFVEHLILTENYILLLGVKRFRGVIFAADKINLWTQLIGKKSYKFENPLHQLEIGVIVLNTKIENTKVIGKVLFINGSEFPKGKPNNVITISDIKELSKESASAKVSNELLADWKKLKVLAENNDLEKGALINDSKGINVYSFVTVIIIVSVWLVWRLKY